MDDLKVTDNNFEEEVLKSKVPVLVDFWGSWCIPSQMMMPILDRLNKEIGQIVKIRKLNVDQNPKMREIFKIMGCPTFILFKNVKEVERRVGAQSETMLKEMINSSHPFRFHPKSDDRLTSE